MRYRLLFLLISLVAFTTAAVATDIDIDIETPDVDIDIDPIPRHHSDISVFYVGPTTLELKNDNLKLEGTTLGLTSYKFKKAVAANSAFGYRHGTVRINETSGQSTKYSIYMPEISTSIDVNIFGLPTIRRLFGSHSPIMLLAGGGAGLSYQPYNLVIDNGTPATPVATPNPFFPNESDKNKWYWDHSTWNYHFFGGFLIDNQVGGVILVNTAKPLSGEHDWEITDIRFGLAYNL